MRKLSIVIASVLAAAIAATACGGKVNEGPIRGERVPPPDYPYPDPTPVAPQPHPGDPGYPEPIEQEGGAGTPGVACGKPVIQVKDCATSGGYEVSSHRADSIGEVEVHVIGVYETRSDHSAQYHPRGTANVHVSRRGRHVLVLSSYEPTDFTITAVPGAIVERVILNGYSPHTATAPAGTPVENHSGAGYYSACAYKWPSDDQGCDTEGLVSRVESSLAKPISDFAGCYRATQFEIADEDASACADHGTKIAGTCGNADFTAYAAENVSSPALVLVGKYESANGSANHPTGSTTVTVTKTAPMILALSSYEATEWKLDAAPGTKIQKIILNGYYAQTVIGAGDIPIESYSVPEWLGGYAYAWPSASGGSDTQGVVKQLEAKTGAKLAAFGGCYAASAFQISDP